MFIRIAFVLASSAVCLAVAPAARPTFDSSRQTLSAEPLPATLVLSDSELEQLARTRPTAMLAACAERCRRELHSYRAVMVKQERMGGHLYPTETIDVACREEPFAVMMRWTGGFRQVIGFDVKATRYDATAKKALLVYRPDAIFQKESSAGPRETSARSAARVGIEEFGVSHAIRRTATAWAAVEKRGELRTEYLGVQTHPDAGNRPCLVLRRTCAREELDPFVLADPPVVVTDENRADSFDSVTVWIDRETWLQVGTEQRRQEELVARYFFRITAMNPALDKDEFSPAALRK